jgi:glycosyltransferase involved in cell wall biosynthesis
MPAISVVMAVRNCDRHVRESIGSILQQTLADFEFIIVDDASSDATPAILAEYADHDARIRILTNSVNLGLAESLNLGLEIAKGSYIARHDADDIAMPWRFEVQFDFLEQHPEYFLCGGTAVGIGGSGKLFGHLKKPIGEKAVFKALTTEMRNLVIHPSMMFRNEPRVRYRRGFVYAQDYDLLLNLLTKGLRIFNLPQVLLRYRINDSRGAAVKGYRQLLYRRAAFRMYQERLLTGTDSYETFDFRTCEAVDLENIPAEDLPTAAGLLFAVDAPGPEIRHTIHRAWNSGKGRKGLISPWLISFTPPAVRSGLRKGKRKLRVLFDRNASQPSVALLASVGGGLSTWRKVGTVSRELAIYERLAKRGWFVSFYTYDRPSEASDFVSPVSVVCGLPFRVPSRIIHIYGYILPFFHFFSGIRQSVVLTNQAHSGWPAVFMGKIWNSRVIARCGYVLGEQAKVLNWRNKKIHRRVALEAWTHRHADLSFIPTEELQEWCSRNMKGFEATRSRIGRLVEEKRYNLIFESLARISGLRVVVIGSGPEKNRLASQARETGVNVEFVDRVPNEELPEYLCRAKIYLIASKWEGHPKSLLEAMACGIASIGTIAPGISNQIDHEKTGLLCGSSPTAISGTISRILQNDELRNELGKNARAYVQEKFPFGHIYQSYENEIIDLMVNDNG